MSEIPLNPGPAPIDPTRDSWGFFSVMQARAKLSLIGYSLDQIYINEITPAFTAALADFQTNHGLQITDGSWNDEVVNFLHLMVLP